MTAAILIREGFINLEDLYPHVRNEQPSAWDVTGLILFILF